MLTVNIECPECGTQHPLTIPQEEYEEHVKCERCGFGMVYRNGCQFAEPPIPKVEAEVVKPEPPRKLKDKAETKQAH